MDIYAATANQHKLQEMKDLLKPGSKARLYSAERIGGMPHVEETGKTFLENARLKAQALLERAPDQAWCLADDSGLAVDALDGRPGVLSARYAGREADDKANNEKLLEELANLPTAARTARFVCCLVLASRNVEERVFRGICEGVITPAPKGDEGFGYDPLFLPHGFEQTFAELAAFQKNGISHRARAFSQLKAWLEDVDRP